MRTLHWLAIIGLVAGAGLVACGSDDSGGGTGGGTSTGGTGGSTGGTGGTGGSATGGSAGSGTGGSAGGATDCSTSADCMGCCATENTAAYTKFQGYLVPCVCGAANDGPCATDCADSYCAASNPADPSDACVTCASAAAQTGSCQTVLADCMGDAECSPFLTCALTYCQ